MDSRKGTLNSDDAKSILVNTLLSMASVYVPLLSLAVMNPAQADSVLFDIRFFGIVVAFALFKTIQKLYEGRSA